jgi:hypothetical protein
MAEQFANAAQTTLNGSISNSVTSLVVTSASAFPVIGKFRIVIDTEIMLVTSVSGTNFIVTRGVENTTATSHANGAAVTQVLTVGALAAFLRSDTGATPLTSQYLAAVSVIGIINA